MTKYLLLPFGIALLLLPFFASAATCPNLSRNLSFGSRGQDVVELQTFLIAQGDLAAGNNTGYFGSLSRAAVRKFQCRANVVCSGTAATTGFGAVGPKTRAAIARVCGQLGKYSQSNYNMYSQAAYYSQASYSGVPCSLDSATVSSGSSRTFFSAQHALQGTLCSSLSLSRLCTNGSLAGDASYKYSQCTAAASGASCTMSASPANLVEGQQTTLAWSSVNAVSASLNGAMGIVATSGSKTVQPTSFTYILTVKDARSASDTCSVHVAVGQNPNAPTCTISAMNINPVQGTAVLLWSSKRATAASINLGVGTVPVNGTRAITLQGWDKSYQLTVSGENGLIATCSATTPRLCTFEDANAAQNPCYRVNPEAIFPSNASILPSGVMYNDTVPDTYDLAERAKSYARSAIASHIQTSISPPGVLVTASPGVFKLPTTPTQMWAGATPECGGNPPCLEDKNGAPNWGMVQLAIFQARAISGYDLSNAAGTITTQLQSLKNMLSYRVSRWFSDQGMAFLAMPTQWTGGGQSAISAVMESLMDRYEADPGNQELKKAIDEYVKMHKDTLIPEYKDGTVYYYWYRQHFPTNSIYWVETWGGYYGHTDTAITNGLGARTMFHWYNLTGNQDAFDIGTKVNEFLRNYDGGELWTNPNPSRFPPDQPGQYFGDPYSYMNVAMAFVEEAEARFKSNPNDTIGRDNIRRAYDMFEFTKRRTRCATIGNCGTSGELGIMLTTSLALMKYSSVLGLDPAVYYEEAERWTRNTLAELQIDEGAASYIGNATSNNPKFDRVREKSIGMFLTDAAHSFAVPFSTFRYNNDAPANAMRGLYDVWKKSVEVTGETARVNMLFNRAGQYFDVKSDLPYRGRVEVDTKNTLGPVRRIMVRIPTWTDTSAVTVSVYDSAGAKKTLTKGSDWAMSGSYAQLHQVEPAKAYVITFPMRARTMQIVELRSPEQWWYESVYGSLVVEEKSINYTGTFLGDTLVDVDPRPTGGVPRYARDDLAKLVKKNGSSFTVTEIAPPQITLNRFAPSGAAPVKASSETALVVSFSSDVTSTPPEGIAAVHLTWSSQNATSCTMSYAYVDGSPGGSFPIATAGTADPGINKTITYSVTCVGTGSATMTKSVTITVAVQSAPTPTCTITANPATIAPGQATTISWNSTSALNASLNGGIGAVALNGSMEMRPTPFTFVLTVTGNSGTGSCSATVTVIS